MKMTLTRMVMLAAASIALTGCSLERSSELLLPTTPGALESPFITGPTVPGPAAPAGTLGGLWTSNGIAVPDPGSCTDFQWQITSATSTSLAGSFSATCGGNITVTGTASGRVEGTSVPISIAGTAVYGGALSCDFSLSGIGSLENNDALTIPYSGTTCLGPVSGTERLTRPSTAAEPAPPEPPSPPPPADPLFGCVVTPDRLDLVECIWDHIRPSDNNSAFEVTKRVAWALRGEGAGLLIKPGGENITAWHGYFFSSSRIVYPDGRLVKVIFDAGPGGANGPSWQDAGDYVDRSFYMPAMDPNIP